MWHKIDTAPIQMQNKKCCVTNPSPQETFKYPQLIGIMALKMLIIYYVVTVYIRHIFESNPKTFLVIDGRELLCLCTQRDTQRSSS